MKSIFIYNPESGSGKILKYLNKITQTLSTRYGHIELAPTKASGDATKFAKEACINSYDYLFVAGGDGTLNEIVNGIGSFEKKPIIGYIPSGTVNDIARSLNISRNINKALNNIMNGNIFEHDIFKVNNRFGIYVCGAGLFTKSSYSTARYEKKKLGKIAYFKKGLKELYNTKPLPVAIEINNETISKSCSMILILNSRSVAGFKLNKPAKLDDGEVEIVMFNAHKNKLRFSEVLTIFKCFLFGIKSLKKSKKITLLKSSEFKITTEDGTTINLDGEKSDEGTFYCKVINKGIKIISPI